MESSFSPKATNASSALQWEQSLHSFCKISEDHILNLKALRADAASMSTDRSMSLIQSLEHTVAPKIETSYSTSNNLEKKIDTMLRRIKFMEERIMGYEESNQRMSNEMKDQARVIEHLLDVKSNNELYIQRLHEEIKKMMKMKHNSSTLDENTVNSLLDSKLGKLSNLVSASDIEQMQNVLQENIDTAMTKIANEQQSILLKWTERYNANARFPLAIEKEIDVLKSKVHSFQELTSNMDKKCADILNTYREELQSNIQSMKHSMGEKFNQLVENNKGVNKSHETKTLEATVESRIDSKLSQINMKILQFESEKDSLYKRVDQLSSSLQLVSAQLAEIDLSHKRNTESTGVKLEQYKCINDENTEYIKRNVSDVHRMFEESESASRVAIESIIDNLERYRNVTDNLIQTISGTLNSYILSSGSNMDTMKQNLAEQSHFIVTMKTDLDSKFMASSQSLEEYKLELGRTLQNLYESDRKTRSKIVEMHEKITVFSKARAIIEKIITEFESRAQEDMAWPRHLKSVTDLLDQRITSFEKTIPNLLSSFQERLAQLENNDLMALANQPLDNMTSEIVVDDEIANSHSNGHAISQSCVSMDEINRKKKLHREEFLKTVHK